MNELRNAVDEVSSKEHAMSGAWAERERRTNKLVRIAANYVFEHPPVSPDQLYGLCRLTWITVSDDDNHGGYVTRVKKPALGQIFGHDFSTTPLTKVAAITAELAETHAIVPLVENHTGFTNFYRPYRNTVRRWIADNFDALLPLFQLAFKLDNDDDGVQIADGIAKLPGIPKAGTTGRLMHPEFLLTPVFFALDNRVRFPIINGNTRVTALLKKLGAGDVSLPERCRRMVAQIGNGGIEDAADLDQVGEDLASLVGVKPTRQLLARKPTDAAQELPLKDEADIQRLQQALRIKARRLHNKLTNVLREKLKRFTLYEGVNSDALFDVLVRQFDDANDLLIEAKSSVEISDTRMAIGQLFDYWFRVKGKCEWYVAVLFPDKPPDGTLQLLDWLRIGALWFEEDRLVTSTGWLEHLQG